MTRLIASMRFPVVLLATVAGLGLAASMATAAPQTAPAQQEIECTWTRLGQSTQPHFFVASAADYDNNMIYYYGGLNDAGEAQDDFGFVDLSNAMLGQASHGTQAVSARNRFGAAGAYRSAGDNSAAYFSGGSDDADDGQGEKDVQVYNIKSKSWTQAVVTGAFDDRFWHSMTYDQKHDVLWVVGGISDCPDMDLAGNGCTASNKNIGYFTIDENNPTALEWNRHSAGGGPSALFGHAAAYSNMMGEEALYVVGGSRSSSRTDKKIFKLDLSDDDVTQASWSSFTPGGGPQGVIWHGVAYDETNNWLVLNGGAVSSINTPNRENVNTKTYAVDLGATPPTYIDITNSFGDRVGGAMDYSAMHSAAIFHGGRSRADEPQQDAKQDTYALKCEVTVAPTPTNTVPAPPTNTPDPSGTQPPPATAEPTLVIGDQCDFINNRVPAAVINAALAAPDTVQGWGQLCNPNVNPSPYNQPRSRLSLHSPGKPYHPIYNSLVWKCGCP